jgi:hypothetical protein
MFQRNRDVSNPSHPKHESLHVSLSSNASLAVVFFVIQRARARARLGVQVPTRWEKGWLAIT